MRFRIGCWTKSHCWVASDDACTVSFPACLYFTGVPSHDLGVGRLRECRSDSVCDGMFAGFRRPALAATPPSGSTRLAVQSDRVQQAVDLADQGTTLLPADEAFGMSVAFMDAASVAIDFAPAADYFLYRDKFAFRVHEPATAIVTSIELPSGAIKGDPFFGRTEIFRGKVRAFVRFQRTSAAPLVLDVAYQGCNARIAVCYPPIEKRLRLELPPPPNLRQRFSGVV